jgi:hypothetical protein
MSGILTSTQLQVIEVAKLAGDGKFPGGSHGPEHYRAVLALHNTDELAAKARDGDLDTVANYAVGRVFGLAEVLARWCEDLAAEIEATRAYHAAKDTPGTGEFGDECPHEADSAACKAWHGPGYSHSPVSGVSRSDADA